MKCPYCRANTTEVYNSRLTRSGNQVWRRRRCTSCHEAFTTYEASDLGFLKVTSVQPKPSARTVHYSRAKLYASIYQAFGSDRQRPDTIDAVTDTIEAKLLDRQQRQVTNLEIARIVLSTLKHFDTAAFVRYLADHTALVSSSQLKRELGKY